jgi:hypothetical protein
MLVAVGVPTKFVGALQSVVADIGGEEGSESLYVVPLPFAMTLT